MISKVFITGKSFGETCRYVCQELKQENEQTLKPEDVSQYISRQLNKAQVLYFEGVRGYDYRLMAVDFERQHSFTPEKEKPVFHGMLSFPAGENPGDARMVEIARQYLQEIGMTRTQFAIVKHTDKEHLHMHIVANRVDYEGQIIGKGLIVERGIKAAQKLTREYKLIPHHTKRLEQTHQEALHEPDAYRYRLYQSIKELLPACKNLVDLEKGLLEQGISMRYRQDRQSGARQGISFRIEQYCFQGSKVDPAYSLKNLERTLELQQRPEQKQDLTQSLKQRPEQDLTQRVLHKQEHKHSLDQEQDWDLSL